ncbi:hypothetical protein BGX26_007050, partial [Mortierella sp. AD094]
MVTVATTALTASVFGFTCSDPKVGRLDFKKVNADVQAALKSWNNANAIQLGQAIIYSGKT